MKSSKTKFGNKQHGQVFDTEQGLFVKNVDIIGREHGNHIIYDYEQQYEHVNELIQFIKGEKKHFALQDDFPKNCHSHKLKPYFPDNPDETFMFAPAFTGNLKIGQKMEVEGNCFEKTSFTLMKDPTKDGKYQIVATMENPRSLTCDDFYLFGNTEILHPEVFMFRGTHIFNIQVIG